MITRGPERELARRPGQRMLAEKTMNAPVASHGDLDFTWTGARRAAPSEARPVVMGGDWGPCVI
jgi:hypothetical protein